MIVPLIKVQRFPRYSTPEEYGKAFGILPPQFDPRRPPKHWFDPKAIDGPRTASYQVIATTDTGNVRPGLDGQPELEPLLLSRIHAATVNIPPNETTEEVREPEVPVPVRPLELWEKLEFGGLPHGGMLGTVHVWDSSKPEVEQPTTFTVADRASLQVILATVQAIAHKVGI